MDGKLIYVVSDSTGETAERVTRATLLQFPDHGVRLKIERRQRDRRGLTTLLERAAAEQARRDAEGILLQAQTRLDAANEEAASIIAEAEVARTEANRLAEIDLANAGEEAEALRSEAAAESARLVDAARDESDAILAEATRRASEVYEAERRRAIERFAQSRDEYEDLARRLRALKEATGDMLTNALRDYEAIRVVLDESSVEVG